MLKKLQLRVSVLLLQDGWGRWQLGFHALFTLAANCPNLKELSISEEHLEVSNLTCMPELPLDGNLYMSLCGNLRVNACLSSGLCVTAAEEQ